MDDGWEKLPLLLEAALKRAFEPLRWVCLVIFLGIVGVLVWSLKIVLAVGLCPL